MALRDAIRWLAEYAGVDQISRARREVEESKLMEPDLKQVVDTIDSQLSNFPYNHDSWRDRHKARWSSEHFDAFVTRRGPEFVVLVYPCGKNQAEQPVLSLPFTEDGISKAIHYIKKILERPGQGAPLVSGKIESAIEAAIREQNIAEDIIKLDTLSNHPDGTPDYLNDGKYWTWRSGRKSVRIEQGSSSTSGFLVLFVGRKEIQREPIALADENINLISQRIINELVPLHLNF
jgi:hypothetical protein